MKDSEIREGLDPPWSSRIAMPGCLGYLSCWLDKIGQQKQPKEGKVEFILTPVPDERANTQETEAAGHTASRMNASAWLTLCLTCPSPQDGVAHS